METGIKEAGFEEVEAYVLRRQITVTQYIATGPIMDLCKKTVRILGTWVVKRWWDQEGTNLVGPQTAAEAAE